MAETPFTADDRTLNGSGLLETLEGHHVDVQQAEEAFNRHSRVLSHKSTKHVEDDSSDDLEKGGENEETFDLREYLTSSNDANQSAGIKHKHVGVTWENLKVDVVGGADHKVSGIILKSSFLLSGRTYADTLNIRFTFKPSDVSPPFIFSG